MPHGKGGQQSTRKNPRDKTSKEDDFELEVDPTAREDTLSPLYSASSAGTASSISSVSSSQLEMILAANSKILADSMASNQRSMEASQKSMESSILSVLSTISTPGSVASALPPAAAPRVKVKLPLWSEDETPSNFFSKMEKALTLNGVPRSQWGQNIHVQLAGSAQNALAQVPLDSIEDYDVIKTTLLDALGDTPEFADRNWWSISRKSGEDVYAFYLRIRACGILRLQGLTSKDEILEKLVLSRFLSLLPADSYAHATDRCPKDGSEAAKLVQQLEQRRAYIKEMQGGRHHTSGRREPSRGGGSQSSNNYGGRSHSPTHSGSGNSSDTTGSSSSPSGSDAKEGTGSNPSSGAPASGGSIQSGGKHDRGNRKQVICHNCGEPGHIRPNCPNRIRSVRSPGSAPVIEVTGLIAGVPVKGLQIDTGAGRTVIDAKHIPRSAYLGKSITLDTWKGRQYSEHKLAKLSIVINGVSTVAVVAVAEDFGCPALLGLDLGPAMSAKITGIVADRTKAALIISESDSTVVPMHSDSKVVTKQQVKSEVPRTQFECKPVALADVLDLPEAYLEPGVVGENHEFVDELELDQNSPKVDDTPVILGDVLEFSDVLFSSDSPVELGEVFEFSDDLFEPENPVPTPVQVLEVCPVGEAGSNSFSRNNSDVEVVLREDCVVVQPLEDLFDFSDSPGGYDSLMGLGDVLDVLDQLFVPVDPVPTPMKVLERYPEGRPDIDCPLPMLKEERTGGTCIIGKASLEDVNFVEDSLVVQPPDHLICVQMEVNILDCDDCVNLVEECVVGLPPVDFVNDDTEAFGSAVDPLGEKPEKLVQSQGYQKVSVTPDKSVSVWFISYPYRVMDRGKYTKSEEFGSSVRMDAACHGFYAWAAALQSLETRCLHLGPLQVTKATRDSFSTEIAWSAFILLIVISVFEYFCSVPLFAISTTDWAEISMSGATCVGLVAVFCAVKKQE